LAYTDKPIPRHILPQSVPVDLSVGDISRQIAVEWLEIGNDHNKETIIIIIIVDHARSTHTHTHTQ